MFAERKKWDAAVIDEAPTPPKSSAVKLKMFFYKSNWGFYATDKTVNSYECSTVINRTSETNMVTVMVRLAPSTNSGSKVNKASGSVSYGYGKLGVAPFHEGTRIVDAVLGDDGSFTVVLKLNGEKPARKYTSRAGKQSTKTTPKQHPLTEAIASVNAWVEKTGATLEIVKGKLTATIRF